MNRLSGKIAMVTGAWRGIGAGVARVLVYEGVKVVVADAAETRRFSLRWY